MCKWITLLAAIGLFGQIQAQNVAINETGAAPDPSAMLDITSTDKGFLAPRLADHLTIAAPATGLLVYNTTTSTFWYYDGTQWIEITFPVAEIRDADGDTWITVEETPDDDLIRFGSASATNQMFFDGKTFHWTTPSLFIGDQSGTGAGTVNNTFVGNLTGSSLAGAANTLFGYDVVSAMTSGNFNVFMGSNVAPSMSAGTSNVVIGAESGFDLTNSDDNVLVGYRAGFNQTTGELNTLVGSEAGADLTTGSRNTYVGHLAGNSNGTQNDNVAVGYLANAEGFSVIGRESVYVGARAGRYANSNANTMIGFRAGEYNTSSFNNTFVGFTAGGGVNTGNNPGSENSFFGHESGRYCNGCVNNVYIGTSAGKGLDFISPPNENTSNSNVFIGHDVGPSITTASNSVLVGRRAGFNLTTGSNNVILGYRAGEFLAAGTSNRFVLANDLFASDVLIWGEFDNNRVGINTTSPDEALSVNGDASKTGGGTWATFSDKRVKQDIAAFSDGLDVVMDLKPVSFRYNANSGYSDTETKFIGFIAQDVEQVAPYMVSLYDDSEGVSGLADKRVFNESALTKVLVNAIQEQQAHIESLEARIERLEKLVQEGLAVPTAVAEK